MRSASNPEASLHEAALDYVVRGWPVLPLVPRAKRPLTKNGLLDASAHPADINRWWQKWPNANIGLRTGVVFDALDIDGDVGRASLSAKIGSGFVHPGPISRTGRGEHWLYQTGETANRAGVLEKLDWRGTNGYIVAAPSIHPDGHQYAWIADHGPDLPLPEVPAWLSLLIPAFTPSRPQAPIILPNPYDAHNRQNIFVAIHHIQLPVTASSNRFVANCIFHAGDHEASLVLYPAKHNFYCFGCQADGKASDLYNRVAWRNNKKVRAIVE